ncbi:MAG: molybdopterin-guanine dinucleotide biosynthesis protein MobB [Candidatus Tectomicrobia bacterium]|nr:molybdopterin-guanine dinucleotide biosynthesis protein MobB [Candidatus Tectomicrobia bacterium]
MSIPVLGFAAYSGTGKTTLIVGLLPILKQRGLRVGVIKHAHHTFDLDVPGKDSFELRKAGADQTLVASRRRWALMVETADNESDPDVEELIARLHSEDLDLILVEGFKLSSLPKIEVYRTASRRPLRCTQDATVIAVAVDGPLTESVGCAVLDINAPQSVADFICHYFSLAADSGGELQEGAQ